MATEPTHTHTQTWYTRMYLLYIVIATHSNSNTSDMYINTSSSNNNNSSSNSNHNSNNDRGTANLRTNIMNFRGFDSSQILISKGGILMSIWDFPERLSQAILVGIMSAGRSGAMGPLQIICIFDRGTCWYSRSMHFSKKCQGPTLK